MPVTGSPPRIGIDDPLRSDVLALLREHLADMVATSPPGSVHALDPQALTAPGITFLSAREDGVLLGVGALKEHADGTGELKSMRTATAARGRGVAAALLAALLDLARERDLAVVRLETGSQDFFAPARRLYERAGFTPCGPFAGYTDDPNSSFYQLRR